MSLSVLIRDFFTSELVFRVDALHNRVDERFESLLKEIQMASAELQNLTREVSEMKTVNQSAITLIHGLADQIREHLDDRAAMQRLADELDADANALGQAVAENTPAEPDPNPIP